MDTLQLQPAQRLRPRHADDVLLAHDVNRSSPIGSRVGVKGRRISSAGVRGQGVSALSFKTTGRG